MSCQAESSEDDESAAEFDSKLSLKYLPVLLSAFKIPQRKKKRRQMLWRCVVCKKDFSDKETLRPHQMACQKKKLKNPWSCKKCDKSYTERSNLQRHVNNMHGKDKVEAKPTTNENREAKKRWACDKCEKSYTRRSNLMKHVNEKHVNKDEPTCSKKTEAGNPEPYDKCDKSYIERSNLQRHVNNMHGKDKVEAKPTTNENREAKKPWACDKCEKSYTHRSNLMRHVNETHVNKDTPTSSKKTEAGNTEPYDKCDKSYTERSNLQRHVNNMHGKDKVEAKPTTNENREAKKRWACDKCEKSYTRRSNLIRHVNETHVNKDNATCSKKTEAENLEPYDECDKSSAHRSHHEQEDNIEEPKGKRLKTQKYNCPFCKKVLLDVLNHCQTVHNILHPEKIIHNDGTPISSKEELEEENRSNDDLCRLCLFKTGVVKFDNTGLLMTHYFDDHKIDPDYLEVLKLLCTVQKSKSDAKTQVVIEESSEKNGEKIINEETLDNKVIYTCKCGVLTESYEKCVEHSQDHLVAKYTKYNNKECDVCKFPFEVSTLAGHRHDDDNNTNDALVVKYDFEKLLTEAWSEPFKELPEPHKNKILLSPYRHKLSRSVRMHLEDSNSQDICTGSALYQCMMCHLFVDPAKVVNHCKNYDSCLKNKLKGHSCDACTRSFYSGNALSAHIQNRDADFKLIKFNKKEDAAINKVLEFLQNLHADRLKESVTSEPENNTSTSNNAKRSCKAFQKDVDAATVKTHCQPLKMLIKRFEGSKEKGWKILNTTDKEQNETKITQADDQMQSVDEKIDDENGSNIMDNDDVTAETYESDGSSTELEMSSTQACDYMANRKITIETRSSLKVDAMTTQLPLNNKDLNGNVKYKRQSTPDLQRILEGDDDDDEEQEVSISLGDRELTKTEAEDENSNNKALYSEQELIKILGDDADAEIYQQDSSEVSSVFSEDEDVTSSEERGNEDDEWPNAVVKNDMRMSAQKLLTQGHMMLNTINYLSTHIS